MTTFELAKTPGLYDQDLEGFRVSTQVAAEPSEQHFVEKRAEAVFDSREKVAQIVLSGDASPVADQLREAVCAAFAKTAYITSQARYRRLQKVARELVRQADAEGWDDAQLEKEAAAAGFEKQAIMPLIRGAGRVAMGLWRPLGGTASALSGIGAKAGRGGLGAGARYARTLFSRGEKGRLLRGYHYGGTQRTVHSRDAAGRLVRSAAGPRTGAPPRVERFGGVTPLGAAFGLGTTGLAGAATIHQATRPITPFPQRIAYR